MPGHVLEMDLAGRRADVGGQLVRVWRNIRKLIALQRLDLSAGRMSSAGIAG